MNTKTALKRIASIPIRRLPNVDETRPTSEPTEAAPSVPEMNSGVDCLVAAAPKTRVNRTMFVGKIAELPSPATAAPVTANVSLDTINKTPATSSDEQTDIRTFSDSFRATIDANPRPRTKNVK